MKKILLIALLLMAGCGKEKPANTSDKIDLEQMQTDISALQKEIALLKNPVTIKAQEFVLVDDNNLALGRWFVDENKYQGLQPTLELYRILGNKDLDESIKVQLNSIGVNFYSRGKWQYGVSQDNRVNDHRDIETEYGECPACGGSGYIPKGKWGGREECPTCGATGKIRR
jgi:hypothetical protein